MKPLSPHRSFADPGDARNVPRVTRRTPIRRRDKPLPGTKTMLCPEDEHLHELVSGRTIEKIPPSRTATILGILAMVVTVALLAFILINPILQQSNPTRHGGIWVFIIGIAAVHVLAIFSQILSTGRNMTGSLAIPVLYVGTILCVVIEHFLST